MVKGKNLTEASDVGDSTDKINLGSDKPEVQASASNEAQASDNSTNKIDTLSNKPEERVWCIDRFDPALMSMHSSFSVDNSLERIFGAGATRLAIELIDNNSTHGNGEGNSVVDHAMLQSSTPSRESISNKRVRVDEASFGDLSNIDLGEESKVEEPCNVLVEAKKQKLGDLDLGGSEHPGMEQGELGGPCGSTLHENEISVEEKGASSGEEDVTVVGEGLHQDPDQVNQDFSGVV